MNTKPRQPRKPKVEAKSYHHGNLRHALLVEGRRLLEEKGPIELSMREVARGVGVSEAAPARHFGGKDGLLAAIATQGFHDLLDVRLELRARGLGKLELASEMMSSYVNFAVRNRGVFNLMVGPRLLNADEYEEMKVAGRRSFELFSSSIVDLALEQGWPPEETELVAHGAWAVEHGLATLVLAERAPRSEKGMQLSEMIDFAIALVLSAIASGPSHFERVLAVCKAHGEETRRAEEVG